MSRDTLQNAKVELHALFCDDVATYRPIASLSDLGVGYVYDHEPRPGDALKGIFVTVSTAGMEPTLWRYSVRVYAAVDVSAKDAAVAIDGAMVAVDNLLFFDPGFGPSLWRGPEWVVRLSSFVATNLLTCPRADL